MVYSIIGIVYTLIGILDMHFDLDDWTYMWLASGVIYSAIGIIILDMKGKKA